MEINALIQRAMQVRRLYAELERKDHGRAWTNTEIALGFVGDVGDLAKLVMAREGIRFIPESSASWRMNSRIVCGQFWYCHKRTM
jgi:hypothetical protein